MTCRHENQRPLVRRALSRLQAASGYYHASEGDALWWNAGPDAPQAITCVTCGEWLSLGPSNDASEQVQLEIRAAELAARLEWNGDETEAETLGFWAFAFGRMPRTRNALAGYLAGFIHHHDDTSKAGA